MLSRWRSQACIKARANQTIIEQENHFEISVKMNSFAKFVKARRIRNLDCSQFYDNYDRSSYWIWNGWIFSENLGQYILG